MDARSEPEAFAALASQHKVSDETIVALHALGLGDRLSCSP